MTKNLCDKVSKIKKLRWQFRRIFRWHRRGVLHFFCRPCFLGEICKTKWTLFIILRAASILHPFCFANFFMKTRLTEKFEYTTTKPTENTLNCHLRFLIFETLSQRFFAAKLGFFQFFQKHQKEAILFCNFLHENWADRKNGVHHDKANGKSFETVISIFLIFETLSQRFFATK